MASNKKSTETNTKNEFNKKEMDIIFEKLLKKSTIVINQRHAHPMASEKYEKCKRPEMKNVNLSYINKIVGYIKKIFDLDPTLALDSFLKGYVEKFYTGYCKEFVIKKLYLFIFRNQSTDIKKQVDVIIEHVKNPQIKTRLPLPQKYLIEKLKKFRKIKITKVKKNVSLADNKFNNEVAKFNESNLNIKVTEKMIDLLIRLDASEETRLNNIVRFCNKLKDQLNGPKNQGTQELYKFAESIIPKLKTLYNSTVNCEEIKECISLCKQLRPEFDKIETEREKKSHDKESLQFEFDMQKSTIDQANSIIEQINKNGITKITPIDVEKLPKFKNCKKFLENSSENINQGVFGAYVEETKKEVEKVISDKLKQTMFGTKTPNSKAILDKILDLF